MKNTTICWMHISDLHFNGKPNMETEELRYQFLNFLKKEKIHCDYIFCTGDIGTATCSYEGAAEYIKGICEITGTAINNLFIVPGNHDIVRDYPERDESIRKISFYDMEYKHQGNYDSKEGTIDDELLKKISGGLTDFRTFLMEIYDEERCNYYCEPTKPHFTLATEDFNIVHIDSTLTYTKYQEKHELIIGTWYLREALNNINPNKPTIVLSHFPITALAQEERKYIIELLKSRKISLWLCGHEHDHILMPYANIYSIQAGELQCEERTNATVLFGTYDSITGTGFIKAYSWFPEGWAEYPKLWDYNNLGRYEKEFPFRLYSINKYSAFDGHLHNTYSDKTFIGETPWENEKFEIYVSKYENGILYWKWHSNEYSKGVVIEKIFSTPLDEYYVGKYEINIKKYIYPDPKAYFLYSYKGTIQLVNGKIIVTFYYGQRYSYMLHGSGASGYFYTGAYAMGLQLYSILEEKRDINCPVNNFHGQQE